MEKTISETCRQKFRTFRPIIQEMAQSVHAYKIDNNISCASPSSSLLEIWLRAWAWTQACEFSRSTIIFPDRLMPATTLVIVMIQNVTTLQQHIMEGQKKVCNDHSLTGRVSRVFFYAGIPRSSSLSISRKTLSEIVRTRNPEAKSDIGISN